MKSKLRRKSPGYRTKKGLSLVELIVGVTIIAMVLASASGVIVTGYKTTIDNAAKNRAAASSASMNEVILKAIKNCGFADQDEAEGTLFLSTVPAGSSRKNPNEPVHAAVQQLYPDVYFEDGGDFAEEHGDYQYTLNTNAMRLLEDGIEKAVLYGVEVTTAVAAPGGFEEIVSFIPYLDQDVKGG